MPRGPLSSCCPRPWGPLFSGTLCSRGRTILAAPGPGNPPHTLRGSLPQPHHDPGCPRTRGPSTPGTFCPGDSLSGPSQYPGTSPVPAGAGPVPASPERPNSKLPSALPGPHCRFLYLIAGPGRCQPLALLHPSSHPGGWALPSTLCVPLRLVPFPRSASIYPVCCPCSQHPSLWCSTALFTLLRVINNTLVRSVK